MSPIVSGLIYKPGNIDHFYLMGVINGIVVMH